MDRRTAALNRTVLAIIGILMLAVAVFALLRAADVAPGILGPADEPVTSQATRDFATEQGWFWPVLAVVLVVIALLALWWLVALTRTDTLRTIRLEAGPHGGSSMPASAASGALEDDLAASPFVRRVRAGYRGSSNRPRLDVAVTMDAGADPAAVRERIGSALERQRRALEMPDLPTVVHLRAR